MIIKELGCIQIPSLKEKRGVQAGVERGNEARTRELSKLGRLRRRGEDEGLFPCM